MPKVIVDYYPSWPELQKQINNLVNTLRTHKPPALTDDFNNQRSAYCIRRTTAVRVHYFLVNQNPPDAI